MDVTITSICDHCGVGAVYRPSAIGMKLYTHGVIVMEFFCVKCRLENRRIIEVDLAEHLEHVGVTATVVHTPGELLEHPPPGTPPIADADVDRIESMSLDVFNRLMRFETGTKEVGDVEQG